MRAGIVTAIFIIPLVFAACAPVGFLGEDTIYDNIWAEPRRLFYNIGESFVPGRDLAMFASYRNFTEKIDLSRVTLTLVVNPNADSDEFPITGGEFMLTPLLVGKGRKQIIVTMGDLATDYIIMVDDPYGVVPDSEETNGGGIEIVWKEPKQGKR